MALVEFGNQAYVITPFTSDYDNILLSIITGAGTRSTRPPTGP